MLLFAFRASAQPYAATLEPVIFSANTGALSGMGTPGPFPSSMWFEWGTSYEHRTQVFDFPAGDRVVYLQPPISGLVPGQIYQCRMVVSNQAGVAYGFPRRLGIAKTVRAWGGNQFGQAIVPPLSNPVAAAGGSRHSVVLQSNGRLVAWGNNDFGQPAVVPPGLDQVAALSAGAAHTTTLRRNGTVVEFGNDDPSHTAIASSLSNIVAVAAGSHHSLALKQDGRVVAWRNNNWGQTNVPSGLSNVVAIAAGTMHSVALRNDGSLVTWGSNEFGQQAVPQGATNIVAISANGWVTLALRRDGALLAWGDGASRPHSSGTSNLANVIEISSGLYHHLTLREDGLLGGWGGYNFGTLIAPPATVSNVLHLGRGEGHALVLTINSAPVARDQIVEAAANRDVIITLTGSDPDNDPMQFRITSLAERGTLYQYAAAARGLRIGAPGTMVTDPAHRVVFSPDPDTAASPYASFNFTISDGSYSSAPGTVTVDVNLAPFAATLHPSIRGNTATLKGMATANAFNATAWFEWGTNDGFQAVTEPVSVLSGPNVAYREAILPGLIARVAYQCRLVVSNSAGVAYGGTEKFGIARHVFAWGYNFNGETNVPAGLSNVVALEAGARHSLALSSDGTVTSWGVHGFAESVPPADLGDVIAIASGDHHSLALRSDGTVRAWGGDSYGETAVPPGLTDVVSVIAGFMYSLALKRDGTIVAWGIFFPQYDVSPPDIRNVIGLAAPLEHGLALRSNGKIIGWGQIPNDRRIPDGISNVVTLSAGQSRFKALKNDGTVAGWGTASIVPESFTNLVAISQRTMGLGLRSDGEVLIDDPWSTEAYRVPAGLNNAFEIAAGEANFLAAIANLKPLVQPLVVPTTIDTDVVISLTGVELEGEPLQFLVKTLPARGQLYQYVSGSRGGAIISPNTLIQDSGGRIIFAPEPDSTGLDYASFLYSASDGLVESKPATVSIQVVGPPLVATRKPSILGNTATLNGMTLPTAFGATAWFEWGASAAYGNISPVVQVGPSSDNASVSIDVSGIIPEVIYHCRLVVSNRAGVSYGSDQRFGIPKSVHIWGDRLAGVTNPPSGLTGVTDISLGFAHALALRRDGTIAAWGQNSYGQLNVPPGLGTVIAVAAGESFSLALRRDGTVAAWGDNQFGQCGIPFGLSNVVAISAGLLHAMALRADGTVVAWGLGAAVTGMPSDLRNVVGIGAGWSYSAAVRIDGKVFAWGDNFSGQTTLPPGLTNAIEIAAAYYHGLARLANGSLVGWGRNDGGQATIPADLGPAATMAVGMDHSVALLTDGRVRVWGARPELLAAPAALSNVVGIAAAYQFNAALAMNVAPVSQAQILRSIPNSELVVKLVANDPDRDPVGFRIVTLPSRGSLRQFDGTPITSANTPVSDSDGRVIFVSDSGSGTPYGSLGFSARDAEYDSSPANVTINILEAPYATTLHPHILGDTTTLIGMVTPNAFDTTVWFEWEDSTLQTAMLPGTLPPSPKVRTVRMQIGALNPNVIYRCRIVASNQMGLAIGAAVRFGVGRTVLAYGANWYGQTTVPPDLTNIVSIAAGDSHSLALRSDGRVFAWGYEDDGQTDVPPGLSNVVAIAAGADHNFAVRSDGTVVAWGQNDSGQADVPKGASNIIAAAAGLDHSLLLRDDGTVITWGGNRFNQLSIPPGLDNVVDIAGGGFNSLAIRDDGTLAAWGDPESGQNNVPAELGNVISAAVGDFHNIALDQSGTVFAWGDNYDGQLGMPIGLNDVIAISAGVIHSIALRRDGRLFSWGSNDYGQRNHPSRVAGVLGLDAGGYHNLVLTINPPPLPEPIITTALRLADGTFRLEFSSPAGSAWQVWTSTELITWTYAGDANEVTASHFQFNDPPGPQPTKRFYHVRSP